MIAIDPEFVAAHLSVEEICRALELRLASVAAERSAAEASAAQAEAEARAAAERAKAAQELAAAQAADMERRAGTLATLTDVVRAQTWQPVPSYPKNKSGVPVAIRSKAAQMFLDQSRARC